MLWLDFTGMQPSPGTPIPFTARIKEVDNARETVDDQGRIVGIKATEALTSQADRGIAKLGQRYESLAAVLQVAKTAVVKPVDPEIDYPAGVEMTLIADRIPALPTNHFSYLQPFSFPASVIDMVAHQPIRAYSASPPRPSDLTNILLVGSEREIAEAFAKSGWSTAASLNGESKLETFRALMEDRGYKEGPVSLLLLEGRVPEMVFQKTNNTFAARHHLRVWRRPGSFDGQPIWLVSATHDIGIEFSDRDETFIHKIDPHIDVERAKVVNDLIDTGKVRSFELVDRVNIPPHTTNATGDPLITDGRIAVLMLGGTGSALVP